MSRRKRGVMMEIIEAALMLMACVSLAWQAKRINDLEDRLTELEQKIDKRTL